MLNKLKKLNSKELQAQKVFMAGLRPVRKKTEKPLVVAMVGLLGSGSSVVSKKLAKLIGAVVIEGEEILSCLRKYGAGFENRRLIAQEAALEMLEQGNNIVLDSDHIDIEKRNLLNKIFQNSKARLIYVKTYADRDIIIGRILNGAYPKGSFFAEAGKTSLWQKQNRPAVIKMREMWRRTPHHYDWENKVGGKWIFKKLPFRIFAEIDTSDSKWEVKVKKAARKILKEF